MRPENRCADTLQGCIDGRAAMVRTPVPDRPTFPLMGRAHGLRVWEAARQFADDMIALMNSLEDCPAGLKSQAITAARSVSNGISEGAGRGSRGGKVQFIRIARGSIEECQDDLRELINGEYIDKPTFYRFWNRSVLIDRMLGALIDTLERRGK